MNARTICRLKQAAFGTISLSLLATLAGCQPAAEQPAAPATAAAPSTAPASTGSTETAVLASSGPVAHSPAPWNVVPAAGKAAIIGHISYSGDPPKAKPINFGPEKKCHDDSLPLPTDETLVVAKDKSVQWVLVHIAGNVPGDYPAPSETVTLDQKGCIFIPHVLAIQVGQPVLVLNSDEVAHNVRCESVRNPSVNFILPTKGGSKTIQFDSWDLGMKLKCDIHFWMNGFIHAMRHPFFHVTGADGWFKIENLPPGEYKLEARHEKLGKESKTITVKEGDLLTADFVFAPK